LKKQKSGAYSMKRLLSVSVVILLSCFFLRAEGSSTKANPGPKSNIKSEETTVEAHLTPLQTKSSLNLNLSLLYPNNPYDFNLKKVEPRFIKPLVKISRLNDMEKSFYTASLVTLTVLNAADCFSTISALKYPGLQEANPIMKPFTKNAWLLTAVKAGIAVYNYHCLKNLHKKNKKLAWVISLAANMAMTYIVVNNFRMIQQARSK